MSAVATSPHMAAARTRLGGLGWVTWRQHRAALGGVVLLLGGLSGLLLVNGLAMHSDYSRLGLTSCGAIDAPSCQAPLGIFLDKHEGWAQFLPRFLEFLPAALGTFIGAPLVAREFEAGTYRFAWTQGRHRVRWIAMKLAILAAALTVSALAFSAVFSWWFGPFEPLMGRMAGGQAYEVVGVVFAARTLFGFALGAFLGAAIRRTVPAMAGTAAGWLAVAWPSVIYLRPLIQAPVHAPEDANAITKGGWTIGSWIQDAAGHHVSGSRLLAQARANGVGSEDSFRAWLARHHYSRWVSYQPESRFWHFQAVEAGAYVVLAAILAALTIWWVRRRAA